MASDMVPSNNDFSGSPPQDDYPGHQLVHHLSPDQSQLLNGPLYQTEVHMKVQNGGSDLSENPIGNSSRREIGDLAVWTLSSAKQGNGVL